jgi:type IV secretory pathway VirJ component
MVGLKRFVLFAVCMVLIIQIHGQDNSLPLRFEKSDSSQYLFFHITGDGGWGGFDGKFAEEVKSHKMSLIMLDANKYFWSAKTPELFASDMVPVLSDYLKRWNKKELVLVGFSFGAEVLPFLYNRLPGELKQKVKELVLITPASTSDFTIHLTDMMGFDHIYDYNVVTEVEKIKATKVLAIFGEKENSTFPSNHQQENCKIAFIKGTHHFTDAHSVLDMIMKELK